MIIITPSRGKLFVYVDGDEHIKLMDAHGMISLAERLLVAARETMRGETLSDREAVHALR